MQKAKQDKKKSNKSYLTAVLRILSGIPVSKHMLKWRMGMTSLKSWSKDTKILAISVMVCLIVKDLYIP